MIDPYRMVVINVIASLIFGLGILVYTYVYPKKKPKLLFLLLFLSFLPVISILRKGTYESGDLSLHVKFAMQFFDNLQQGNIVPQWIGNHCSGYGCPVYMFIFPLPYYLISFFHYIGFSFIASVKVFLILLYMLSGIGMYLWIKDELGEKAGFVAAIFYLFAPYHLIDLHFRVSIGELLSMAFLPFLFLTTKKLIDSRKLIYFVLTAVLLALLIISHQVTTFASFPLLLIYSIIVWLRNKKRKFSTLFFTLTALFYGVLFSAFYWIPVILEGKYISYNSYNSVDFRPLSNFFYSPNRFGLLFQGHSGELYFIIGYVQWIVIVVSLYFLLRKKIQGKEKILMTFSVIVFAVFFFMMQAVSKPIWDSAPILNSFQFSWRLHIEVMIVVSIMAAILTKKINRNIFIILLCSITVLYTILNWSSRKMLPNINDTFLRSEKLFDEHPGANGVDLTTPKWVDKYQPWIGKTPQYHIETLSGKTEVTTVSRKITKHEYIIVVKQDALIKENTYYFPGWKLFVNDRERSIDYNNGQYKGVITFHLKKGVYYVKLLFTYTPIVVFAQKVSIFAAVTFLLLLLIVIRNAYFIKRKNEKEKN